MISSNPHYDGRYRSPQESEGIRMDPITVPASPSATPEVDTSETQKRLEEVMVTPQEKADHMAIRKPLPAEMTPEKRMLLLNRSSLRWVSTALMDLCDEKGIEPITLVHIWAAGDDEGAPTKSFDDLLIDVTAKVAILRSARENGSAVFDESRSRINVLEVVEQVIAPLAQKIDTWRLDREAA